MDDRWFSRDLPVLEAIVELCDAEIYPLVRLDAVAEKCGLPLHDVAIAARIFDDAGLIDLTVYMGGDPSSWLIKGAAAETRRLTGAWPTPDGLAARLLDALEQEALVEADPKKKQWLSRLLGGAGEVSRTTAVELLSSVIAKVVTGQ